MTATTTHPETSNDATQILIAAFIRIFTIAVFAISVAVVLAVAHLR